jgi:CoA:oxalate CoA-transferase
MIKPLEGIRVVDLSRALAGPYCTALLADMGAEIIKVESLNGGDIARQWPPFQNDHSLYFDSVNRNKRSVCIDLYSAEGREIFEKLIVGSDVLVENFKLGTLEKPGGRWWQEG